MGVLKTLTEEYFKKTARVEDGKYIDANGYRIIVPIDCVEDNFDESLELVLKNTTFVYASRKENWGGWVDIKCKNSYLMMSNYESFHSSMENDKMCSKINEDTYGGCINYLRYVFKDIDLIENQNRFYMTIDDGSSFLKIQELAKKENVEQIFSGLFHILVDDFYQEFAPKVEMREKDIIFKAYDKEGMKILIDPQTPSKYYIPTRFMYIKYMNDWWKEHIDKLEKIGIKEYFKNKLKSDNGST